MENFSFEPFPVLQSQRLILREISLEDAPHFFELRSSKEVMRYIDRPLLTDIQDVVELILKIQKDRWETNGITWAITEKDQNILVGTIGFWRIDKTNFRAEIGYMLRPDKQRKGFVQEAIQTVLPFSKNVMKMHSIEANINPENMASEKLLLKCGFKQEAFYKENFFYNGNFIDTKIFSLLTRDLVE